MKKEEKINNKKKFVADGVEWVTKPTKKQIKEFKEHIKSLGKK